MDTSTYVARRKALRGAVSGGAILIMGNNEAPLNYTDNVYPFRQDSNFLYFVGVSQAGMAALLEPDGREVLFGAPEDPDDLVDTRLVLIERPQARPHQPRQAQSILLADGLGPRWRVRL